MASEPMLGAIFMFGGNFAPRGYLFCQGQLLSIAQNTALVFLLGTSYGGDGVTTFGLPDLRGRAPVGVGQGPGQNSCCIRPALHPVWLRCSSLKYAQYSRSSRLASRAHRRPRCSQDF